MIEQTGNFVKHHADVLRTQWHRDAHHFFDGHNIGMLITHHRHIVETIHVRQGLKICTMLGKLFSTTVQQTNVWVCALDDLAIELKHQTQHAVCGRMLWSKIKCVVFNFCHD